MQERPPARPRSKKTLAVPTRTGEPRLLGVAVSSRFMDGETYRDLVSDNFDSITAENEMKPASLQPKPNVFNFAPANNIVEFARTHDMPMRGHALNFSKQDLPFMKRIGRLCSDLLTGASNRNLARRTRHDHINKVMKHYPYIEQWDVVNEPLKDNGKYEGEEPGDNNPWYTCEGPGYIADSLRIAHAANPDAELFINEYNAELPGPRRDALVKLARDLQRQGVPIHGVGLQTHVTLDFLRRVPEFAETMRIFANMGLKVEITELDVTMPEQPSAADLVAQRRVYKAISIACVREPGCARITVWGLAKRHSWQEKNDGVLFDGSMNKKQAYNDIRKLIPRARNRKAAY